MPPLTKAYLIALMTLKYHDLNLDPQTEDCWILDVRNHGLIGPFTGTEQAKKLGVRLNDFVRRNGHSSDVFFVHNAVGDPIPYKESKS